LQLVRRFPVFALLCSLAVLLCELVSRPYTTMGVGDDGPYILMAQTLAKTGHLAYNGWEAAMIASQLYLAEALIHFFGFSFTIVRSSTLLIAMSLAFLLPSSEPASPSATPRSAPSRLYFRRSTSCFPSPS
jgi:hypothetical protein